MRLYSQAGGSARRSGKEVGAVERQRGRALEATSQSEVMVDKDYIRTWRLRLQV